MRVTGCDYSLRLLLTDSAMLKIDANEIHATPDYQFRQLWMPNGSPAAKCSYSRLNSVFKFFTIHQA